jgi:uncharacterized delta-60 repeat protein
VDWLRFIAEARLERERKKKRKKEKKMSKGMLWALFVVLTAAQPGTLDPAFGNGTGSIIYTDLVRVSPSSVRSKVIIGGLTTAGDSAIMSGKVRSFPEFFNGLGDEVFTVRISTLTGDLISSYGTAGIAKLSIPAFHGVSSDIAFQEVQQKLILSTYWQNISFPSESFARIYRLNLDGSVDSSFGTVGYVELLDPNVRLHGLGVMLDSRIVVCGQSGIPQVPFVMRFLPNGQPDMSFGGTGIVRLNAGTFPNGTAVLDASAEDLVLSADDGVWVIGKAGVAAIWRLNSDGSFDQSFGSGGYYQELSTTLQFNGTLSSSFISSPALAFDQSVVVGGGSAPALFLNFESGHLGQYVRAAVPHVANFGSNGFFDFKGNDPVGVAALGDEQFRLESAFLSATGKITAGGHWQKQRRPQDVNMVVFRLFANGTLDPGFGGGGGFAIFDSGGNDQYGELYVLPNGNILLVGSQSSTPNVENLQAVMYRGTPETFECGIGSSCTCDGSTSCAHFGNVHLRSGQRAVLQPSTTIFANAGMLVEAGSELQASNGASVVAAGRIQLDGGRLTFNASVVGTFRVLESQQALNGTLDVLTVTSATSSECYNGAIQQSSTTLSVVVQTCDSGLSTGAIVGIAVGVVVGAVLVAVGIVLLSKYLIRRSTASQRAALKESELNGMAQNVQMV